MRAITTTRFEATADQPRLGQTARTLPLWVVVCLCLLTTAGCRGCFSNDSEKLSRKELEKRAQEQKEAVVRSNFFTLPTDSEIKTVIAKPGHWVETVQQVKSNREDLPIIATGDVMRGNDAILTIPGTNMSAEFSRPTILPKGQTKTIDLQYFVPTTSVSVDPNSPISTALKLRSSLVSRSLLTPLMRDLYPTNELKYEEFLIVVVSPKPLEYSFLSATDMVLWRGGDLMQSERVRSFYVILCGSQEGKIALPTSLMTMTTTAAIVWDDLSPEDLSEEQRTAMIDWLHWGGQLIVSGPSSWSRLQNSFLIPYLPIRGGESIELGTEEFRPLDSWVVDDATGQPQEPIEIVGSKIPGLRMQLADEGQWLPLAGELVAERKVGRGRVVVTGFPLREQRLYRWKYYSSFFSTGLLRRPARRILTHGTNYEQVWHEPNLTNRMEKDPRLNTQLRFVARDMLPARRDGQATEEWDVQFNEMQRRANLGPTNLTETPRQVDVVPFTAIDLEALQWSGNGAAWTDTSGFAFRALEALRDAAGIVLPDRWTILYLIAGYLAILVPLNWLFFRLLGRLEYAWIAAPIIALVGVAVVTKVARLDIGFARRTTAIGLLELHGQYPRGHLTSYVALYTSLSTNYAIDYTERGSVALPLGDISRRVRRSGDSARTLQARYGSSEGMQLDPLTVLSNSTEMMHSEQMVPLAGGVLYGIDPSSPSTAVIKNTTGLSLKSCCLVRKNENGQFQLAWIGDMPDSNTRNAQFVSGTTKSVLKYWDQSSITQYLPTVAASDSTSADARTGTEEKTRVDAPGEAGGLMVGGLLNELLYAVPLVAGQVRLLGYSDDQVAKFKISPSDDQFDSRLVVVAHLQPAAWLTVTPDTRIIGRLPNTPQLGESDSDDQRSN